MVQRSALCRSRRELSNASFLAEFGSIQLRTSPVKFACSPRTDPPGVIWSRIFCFKFRHSRHSSETPRFDSQELDSDLIQVDLIDLIHPALPTSTSATKASLFEARVESCTDDT